MWFSIECLLGLVLCLTLACSDDGGTADTRDTEDTDTRTGTETGGDADGDSDTDVDGDTDADTDAYGTYETFHLGPGGDDFGDGLTYETRWLTLGKANQTLLAGQRVLIYAGTYSEQVRPQTSGNSDAERIIYQAAGDGAVVLDAFVYGNGDDNPWDGLIALGERSYVTVSGIAPGGTSADRYFQLRPTNTTEVYGNFTGSTGCVVENAIMEHANAGGDLGPNRGWAFSDYIYPGNYESRFNVLRSCEIHGYPSGGFYTEDTITLAHNAHHNLIENCYIGRCRHVSLNHNQGTTHTNVMRNNVVDNPDHTALSLYGFGEANYRQDHHLIEGNTLIASGETSDPPGGTGNSLQFAAYETVVRYNVITEGGSVTPVPPSSLGGATISCGSNGPVVSDNRFYNNTIVHHNAFPIPNRSFGGETDRGRNFYWNNIVFENMRDAVLVSYWRSLDDGRDRYVANVWGNPGGTDTQNIIDLGSGGVTLATAAATYSNPDDPDFSSWYGYDNVYDGNLDGNSFVDYSGKDYHLLPSSPYAETGAPLTRVASGDSGSGTSLQVEDSRAIYGEASEFPTWMGVHNDWIAVGSDPVSAIKIQIQSVDDQTNTIVLISAVSRSSGDMVWLWRDSSGTLVIKGNAPAIGAFDPE